jgi:hypothetical protein
MTSPIQVEANRRNARKSTGPRTPEGKARSRLNALTHGLTARTPILPGEDEPEYARRLAAWRNDLAPCNPYEEDLVRQAVSLSWRLDRIDRVLAALRADRILNGPIAEAEARRRREAVEDLGRRLWPGAAPPDSTVPNDGRGHPDLWRMPQRPDDPDDPIRLVNRLERSDAGCRWLLDRWTHLRAAIDAGRAWSPAEVAGAIRMLGKWPIEAADDPRVRAIFVDSARLDADRPDPFAPLWETLAPQQVEGYRERLRRRGDVAVLDGTAEQARERLLEVVDGAVEALEALEPFLRERDATGPAGPLVDDSPEAGWLRHHQDRATRGMLRIVDRLRAARRRGIALTPDPPGRRAIDADRPAGAERHAHDRPPQPAPAPEPPVVRPPEPARPIIPHDADAVDPKRWPGAGTVRRDPAEHAPRSRRPGRARAARVAPRGLRLLAAMAMLLPFVTAVRPTDGSTPTSTDRSGSSGRSLRPAAPGAALADLPTALTGLEPAAAPSRPRNRRIEPNSSAVRPGNRRIEPIFGPAPPALALGGPDPARSLDRPRGPPGGPATPPWLDRPPAMTPAAASPRPRAPGAATIRRAGPAT